MAHNIKFDLLAVKVFDYLKENNIKTEYPVMSNGHFIWSFKKGNKTIKFVDTFNYFKFSLKKMGEKLNLKKLRIDFNNATEEDLIEYCERDVCIIERMMLEFIAFLRKDKLGGLGYTIASTALIVYRSRFLEPIFYHRNEDLLRFERSAYKGARTDCYAVGNYNSHYYYYLDVNSMYPHVMLDDMPVEFMSMLECPDLSYIQGMMDNSYLIADVIIDDTKLGLEYGLFGVKHNDKLLFPKGVYRVTLHHKELELAIKRDIVKTVLKAAFYRKGRPFDGYVHYFYEKKRAAANQVDREIAKVFLNALYGKFGMRVYEIESLEDFYTYDEISQTDDTDFALGTQYIRNIHGKINMYYRWGNTLVRAYTSEEKTQRNVNVAIAGCVTANARMVLLNYIEAAGHENCYYSDTDSLIVNQKGLKNLSIFIDHDKLGYLKNEGRTNHLDIRTLKDYTFGEKICKKGVPKDYDYQDGVYSYWSFTTFRSYLRNQEFGRILQEKQLTESYDKGIVGVDGRVTAHTFNVRDGNNYVVTS
jgi:hypothetical protein